MALEMRVYEELTSIEPKVMAGFTWRQLLAVALVATWPHHYILRTSWVVGDGPNFVRTMARLADQGASPSVVADQHGRLTFADDLARAVQHVLTGPVPYGTYNVTSDGDTMTWFDVARAVFDARGAEGEVSPTTTAEFSAGRAMAPRPRHSTLSLDKIKATGFEPADGMAALRQYLGSLE